MIMSTTIANIRTAIKSVIDGLTPSGTAHGRASYQQADEYEEWESRAGSDIDREYTIGVMPPGSAMAIGLSTSAPMDTSFVVRIGHWKLADLDEAQERMDTDVYQIVRALEDKDNYSSGVCLIRNEGATRQSNEERWITDINFRIIYDGVL